MMRELRKGNDTNQLKLVVDDISIQPWYHVHDGSSLMVTVAQYNLEDLLIQLLEDYGDEELLKRIKALG